MKGERTIFAGLLYPAICMYAWSTELLNAQFFSLLPLLPLMIILTKKPYEYCNVQFDYSNDDDSDDGGNDLIRGRVQKEAKLHMVPHVHYFYFLLLFLLFA